MILRGALVDPPAEVAQITNYQRCYCPECILLDRAYPGQGFQLAMFPYLVQLAPKRRANYNF